MQRSKKEFIVLKLAVASSVMRKNDFSFLPKKLGLRIEFPVKEKYQNCSQCFGKHTDLLKLSHGKDTISSQQVA